MEWLSLETESICAMAVSAKLQPFWRFYSVVNRGSCVITWHFREVALEVILRNCIVERLNQMIIAQYVMTVPSSLQGLLIPRYTVFQERFIVSLYLREPDPEVPAASFILELLYQLLFRKPILQSSSAFEVHRELILAVCISSFAM